MRRAGAARPARVRQQRRRHRQEARHAPGAGGASGVGWLTLDVHEVHKGHLKRLEHVHCLVQGQGFAGTGHGSNGEGAGPRTDRERQRVLWPAQVARARASPSTAVKPAHAPRRKQAVPAARARAVRTRQGPKPAAHLELVFGDHASVAHAVAWAHPRSLAAWRRQRRRRGLGGAASTAIHLHGGLNG